MAILILKEVQSDLRKKKVKEFGAIGLKTDCEFYNNILSCTGECCRAMRDLYCKCEVCHFYSPKVKSDE